MNLMGLYYFFMRDSSRFFEMITAEMYNEKIKSFSRQSGPIMHKSQKYVNNIIHPLKILNSDNIGCWNYQKRVRN